jgi:trimeric autotransporter adhesin
VTGYHALLLLTCAPVLAQQYTISTIAGQGVAGVVLNDPTSVAVDSAGDVYIADWTGYIRKVWMKESATTVVAGTGILGYSGDGGPAINARIGKAIALALDSEGNLYVADGDNNRIRRVDSVTGVITTVASEGVSEPTGITVDPAGNIYFSSGWAEIFRIAAGTGTIEHIAGQPTTSYGGDGGPAINALFSDPVPGGCDTAGDIFLADFENSRIREIQANTGIVNTVAGTGKCVPAGAPFNVTVCQAGFSGDGGPATSANLNYAEGVALDGGGNLYIADTINHRVRRVSAATGIIETIAGSGTIGYSGDGGPAVAAEMSFPAAIAVDRLGRIYFADENNNAVRMLTPVSSPLPLLRRDRRHQW